MGQFDSQSEAALARIKSENLTSSPIDSVVDRVANLGGFILEAIGVTGASGGIGFLTALKNLAANKDEANLIYFGDTLIDDIRRMYRLYEELKQQFNERISSPEFNAVVANATLHITRTNVESRLKRLAHLIANGVKEDDLEPESLDDMMRAAVELKELDVKMLQLIASHQPKAVWMEKAWYEPWLLEVRKSWVSKEFQQGMAKLKQLSDGVGMRSSLSRLQAFGFIISVPPNPTTKPPVYEPYALLPAGANFLQRLKELV